MNPFFSFLMKLLMNIECLACSLVWKLQGGKKPNKTEQMKMAENVTFIFKSFERQKMAIGLYKNIRKYYPEVKVIIADDSKKPLSLNDDNLEVINLPFNSGLSFGIEKALERVETPFVIRMDDDELLTPFTDFHKHLQFLMEKREVDLVAVSFIDALRKKQLQKTAENFYKQDIRYAFKPLKIPHLTKIDDEHIVVGKPPNIFIARTDAIRKVGYDKNIRMIDHHEFFLRAAGNIVSAFAPQSFVFHRHDISDKNYLKYRSDYQGDKEYIAAKLKAMMNRE